LGAGKAARARLSFGTASVPRIPAGAMTGKRGATAKASSALVLPCAVSSEGLVLMIRGLLQRTYCGTDRMARRRSDAVPKIHRYR
jgi:hypothetical protein